jgi:hypothetical protein
MPLPLPLLTQSDTDHENINNSFSITSVGLANLTLTDEEDTMSYLLQKYPETPETSNMHRIISEYLRTISVTQSDQLRDENTMTILERGASLVPETHR